MSNRLQPQLLQESAKSLRASESLLGVAAKPVASAEVVEIGEKKGSRNTFALLMLSSAGQENICSLGTAAGRAVRIELGSRASASRGKA